MTLDLTAGVSLKAQHYADALACDAPGIWFEAHPENYMSDGGPRLAWLDAIAARHPLSFHGVGLSLAADEPLDEAHLASLRRLVDRCRPAVVSEHLAWSARGGTYWPDLFPFPRTAVALARITRNVDRMQQALGRRVLIENPSLYVPLAGHEMSELELLCELTHRTGCGLLIDVNNVHVTAHNLGQSATAYIDDLPGDAVGEIHLAGCDPDARLGHALLIDTHAAPVSEAVWALYRRLIDRIGPRPTLIERDDQIPPFGDLMAERDRAHGVLVREAADA